jgi:hypothetical protein
MEWNGMGCTKSFFLKKIKWCLPTSTTRPIQSKWNEKAYSTSIINENGLSIRTANYIYVLKRKRLLPKKV